jgi:hypothetical protein
VARVERSEVEEIRRGVKDGVRGPVTLSWVERLLRDRDERVRRDREIAAACWRASRCEPRRPED